MEFIPLLSSTEFSLFLALPSLILFLFSSVFFDRRQGPGKTYILSTLIKKKFFSLAKLLSRAVKIAYTLLNKTVVIPSTSGSGGKERVHLCLPGDRVALVYPNNEAPAFLCAFYGCLLAGVVPVPIEVPTAKRSDTAGIQQFGFLLGSCGL